VLAGAFAEPAHRPQPAIRASGRVAAQLDLRLRFPAPALATAISAALNGLAFERAADPEAIPDEVLAEFITAVLACAVAGPDRV